MGEEQFTESCQDPASGFSALRRIGGGRNPRHTDTLQGSVSKVAWAWRELAAGDLKIAARVICCQFARKS
ncbi:hypothetical protein AHiyo1_22780 [Arthrobacter sp. Hiyo1]|nr:hypothetical protein AHiyo1_22780 [Arthrobacter sp. Hiyo1]